MAHPRPRPRPLSRPTPDQLNEIYPNLYLGDLTAAESPHILEAYAITHILSLTSHRPRIPKSLVVSKKHYRIRDNTAADLLAVLPSCIRRLEYILGDEDGGVDVLGRRRRVLVHCRMGMSRSGGVVVAYVMKFAGCPAEVALEYVREMRPIVHPNRAFMAQLELWGACGYDTRILEDRGEMVEGVDGGIEEEEEDEEALLVKAVEMSLVEERGEVTEEVWAEVVADSGDVGGDVDMGSDVDMSDSTPIDQTLIPPQPPPSQDTTMDDPPESVPLPDTPVDEKPPQPDLSLQLEERRRQLQEKGKQPEVLEEKRAESDEWGLVLMQPRMKRCFEECLRDVEEEFGAVEAVG